MPSIDIGFIERFCIIGGSARTGSTLICNLLDAHPNIAMANESNAPNLLIAGKDRDSVYTSILECCISRAKTENKWTDYDYKVPGLCQGNFEKIRVIGDKSASPAILFMHAYHKLIANIKNTVGVRFQFIHCIRNPYDAISTMHKRSGESLRDRIGLFFNTCEAIFCINNKLDPDNYMEIKNEELISNPSETLIKMTAFLGIEENKEYINAACSIIRRKQHNSRNEVHWPDEIIELVEKKILEYDFLNGYTFE